MRAGTTLAAAALTALAAATAPTGLPSGYACADAAVKGLPFCDPALPVPARVADLLARLNVTDKFALLGSQPGTDMCGGQDPGVPSLGLAPVVNLMEANSGVSAACYVDGDGTPYCPTIFPAPLSLAASFNRTLWRLKGAVVGREARAFNNLRAARIYGTSVSLLGFGPDINLIVDPRNGRNGENPGEDPALVGAYAVEYVRGAQEGADDPRYLQLSMGLKHFTAYEEETDRMGFNANVSTFDLWDSYLPPYAAGFTAGRAAGSMCSYASVNGIPSCANGWLLNEVVRGHWGRPDATTVSDCGAIENQVDANHYAVNYSVATAGSVRGGCDWCMGTAFLVKGGLADAVDEGRLTGADLDAALTRLLSVRMRLGMFDDPAATQQVFTTYGTESIGSAAHRAAAYEATAQGLVLLKNEGGVLPVDVWAPSLATVAVVGPHAVTQRELVGDFYEDALCPGPNTAANRSAWCVPTLGASVADVLAGAGRGDVSVLVSRGVDVVSNDTSGVAAALAAVAAADVVVLAVGFDWTHLEHEGADHADSALPGLQPAFAAQVFAAAAARGAPVVLVLVNAGALAIDAQAGPASAIIEAFYPAFGAPAVARALFGLENRWGRLPYTMYPHAFTAAVALADLAVSGHPPGRTYRYFNESVPGVGPALFRFGDGLSYSSFASACAGGPATVASGDAAFTVSLSCNTTNVGSGPRALPGDEILMVYHRPGDDVRAAVGGAHPVPRTSLRDFTRLGGLAPGGPPAPSAFTLGPADLALVTANGTRVLYPGTHYVDVSPRPPGAPFTLAVTVTGPPAQVGPAPPLPPWWPR
jgi:xylan 1,4-beta-xylosidase